MTKPKKDAGRREYRKKVMLELVRKLELNLIKKLEAQVAERDEAIRKLRCGISEGHLVHKKHRLACPICEAYYGTEKFEKSREMGDE